VERRSGKKKIRPSVFRFGLIPETLNLACVLSLRLGLSQTCDPVAVLPLAALLEQLRALKALKYVPFAAQCGGCPQAPML